MNSCSWTRNVEPSVVRVILRRAKRSFSCSMLLKIEWYSIIKIGTWNQDNCSSYLPLRRQRICVSMDKPNSVEWAKVEHLWYIQTYSVNQERTFPLYRFEYARRYYLRASSFPMLSARRLIPVPLSAALSSQKFGTRAFRLSDQHRRLLCPGRSL